MDQGRTDVNGPHQGAWVELKSGESWFVHFQDRGAYGRIVHLQPLTWENDWPVIGVDVDGDGKGEPVATHRLPNVGRKDVAHLPQTNDEFNDPRLGLQWQWHANPGSDWLTFGQRHISLYSIPWPAGARNLWSVPNLLLQKLPAREFTVTTLIDASHLRDGERSGMVMMGRDYSYLAVLMTAAGVRVARVTCLDAAKNTAEEQEAELALKQTSVYLRVTLTDDASCEFSFSRDGKRFEALGKEFKAKQGMWIGAKVGLFALGSAGATDEDRSDQRGYADYDWFRFAPRVRSAQTHARAR